jgi:hypothetical protein
LSRHGAAIRDFYDVDYAVRKRDFLPQESAITELIRKELAIPGNEPGEISPDFGIA